MAITSHLRSPPGVALTTALQTVYTLPADSTAREIVQITFPNVDGVNDAAILACNWIDASAANASLPILPVNVTIPKRESITVSKVLDPGDSIRASASANGDIVAIVEIIGREALN